MVLNIAVQLQNVESVAHARTHTHAILGAKVQYFYHSTEIDQQSTQSASNPPCFKPGVAHDT